ncbi:MAG: helicase associated domain-containing protein [Magnetococcales bacterium]|nr:helicase associated domain-containing protein [Magnetococcales bacterium]
MLPRHPKAKHLLERGLFNDLTRFAELESRLLALEDPQERQAGFAVFAEGILTARSLHRAVEIWPTGFVPLDARRRLGLPETIPGADGLFRSLEGEIHAYQLLLRPDRDKPTSEEAERFPPLVARTIQPLLFTNGDQLPNSWKKLKNFHCIRGVDLDRLEPRLFQILRRWLQGAGAAIERPVTPPFHVVALEKIQTLLNQGDQANLIIPPGAEAELLLLRLIQRLGGRRVVVVILSNLDQLIQCVRLWRTVAGWGDLAALQVAEDPSGNDPTPAELDFPLTLHQDGIRRFLAWQHTGVRVILATQATTPVLAKAMMGFAQPDLLIGFNTMAPIPASKRLCLHDFHQRPKEIVESLPLPRGWHLQLLPISSPHVVITEILAWVAQQESIRHTHLYLSESASTPLLEGKIVEIPFFHLSTEQNKKSTSATSPWTERDRCLTAFNRARRAILLHTPPLSSVTRPFGSVDLVVFLTSPGTERHFIEALQPLLAQGSTPGPGLILLPLFLKDGQLADNDLLWEILHRLHNLDDSFASAIRSAMEQLGREGRFDVAPLLKWLKFLPGFEQEADIVAACLKRLGNPWDQRFGELQNYCLTYGDGAVPNSWPENPGLAEWAIRQRKAWQQNTLSPEQMARLEQVGFVRDLESFAWDKAFQRLKRFPEDLQLVEWIEKQRHLKKKEKLEPERVQRLDEIHFVWDLEEAAWEESFQLFLKFKGQRGHGKIPSHFPEDEILGKWAEKQRKEYQQKKLLAARQERLDAEGFVWDLAAAAWDEMLEILRKHRLQYGHGKVPKEWPINPILAIWAEDQRRLREKGVLAQERVDKLDAVDFVWDLKKARWEEGWLAFLNFVEQSGHGKIPDPYPDLPLLDQWAREMRRSYRLKQLPPQTQTRLEEAGFVWDLEVAAWEEQYANLARFREMYGHVAVNDPCPEFPLLPAWILAQRRAGQKGILSPEWRQRLDALEFIWDPAEKYWNDMFVALTHFFSTQGHFNVPKEWSEPPELFNWVKAQRVAREKEKLDEEKITRLVNLGFIWDSQEAAWEEMMLSLTRFQQARNHCLVPAQWPTNPTLARWVEQQRRDYRLKLLDAAKIERLEVLGFIWDAKAIFWEEMFAALTEYRERHGDCLVPETYVEQSQLAWWVAAQRKARLADQLEPERIQRLDAIGFVWDAQEVIWQESLRELTGFRARFGHCIVPAEWSENPRLAAWVMAQRNARIKGHLGDKREAILTALGMIWDPKEAVAEEIIQQLIAFKARYGHCEVPLDNPEHHRLGMWMQFQRQAKKDDSLDLKRMQRLEEIGVVWK